MTCEMVTSTRCRSSKVRRPTVHCLPHRTINRRPAPTCAAPDQSPSAGTDLSRQLLAAVNKLTRAVEELPRLLRGVPPTTTALPASEDASGHYLVYVHGICRHDPGYSNPWWDALSPYVPSLQPGDLGGVRREVLWSDLIGGTRALARPNDEATELAGRLRDVLADRADRYVLNSTPPATTSAAARDPGDAAWAHQHSRR